MKKFNFTTPDFLLCEIPKKDGSLNDNRIWIYSLKSLSLIEFINVDALKDFDFVGYQERFIYDKEDRVENWFGVYVQNNCKITETNEKKIINQAWNYLKEYLTWEDNKNREQLN